MSQDPLFPAFVIFMGATVAWLVLVWRLFTLMKARTPDAYASIGQPHMFWNNTISNNLLFLRFLLGGGYANVNDDGVRRLCTFLRVFFWCYLVGFLAFGAAVFMAPGSRI